MDIENTLFERDRDIDASCDADEGGGIEKDLSVGKEKFLDGAAILVGELGFADTGGIEDGAVAIGFGVGPDSCSDVDLAAGSEEGGLGAKMNGEAFDIDLRFFGESGTWDGFIAGVVGKNAGDAIGSKLYEASALI